jgi:hypothetical protein
MRLLLGIDITRCPDCGEPLHREVLGRSLGSPAEACLPPPTKPLPPWNTS